MDSQDQNLQHQKSPCLYKILEAGTAQDLVPMVNSLIDKGWQPSGSPFIMPWSPGHGCCYTLPNVYQEQGDSVHATICQAMVLFESSRNVHKTIQRWYKEGTAENAGKHIET